MTAAQAPLAICLVTGGFVCALILVPLALKRSPGALVRTNVSGLRIPAVLGGPLVVGGAMGCVVVALLGYTDFDAAAPGRVTFAVGLVVVVAGVAGLVDDMKGDEPARGFRGHLAAAARGRITGGLVKILLVGGAGLGAGALTGEGRYVFECAAVVALSANLINLLDRSPGRALKVSLLAAIPLVVVGAGAWSVASAGLLGAAVACLPVDLAERGMLGDAGSNALGATLGLGLALAASEVVLLTAVVVLAGLNLASEKWSFSLVISRTKPLAAFDAWGRRSQNESK